jgi:urea carboxylase
MNSIEVIKPGIQTTIQDYPGRVGYWDVGVPPSGPMDSLAFRFANQILGNEPSAVGLEITLVGPELKFHTDAVICLTGAPVKMLINNVPMPQWNAVQVKAGSVLKIESIIVGMRCYLCFKEGLNIEPYLDSQSTFTLGKFGGHQGRALEKGDQLFINEEVKFSPCEYIDHSLVPLYRNDWTIHVLYGPQGAPDFFTKEDIDTFFKTDWEIHYNSSRTGVRLIGPKPNWARNDGGEAGLHPSNLHDNPYAIGTIDFTGDMPVILGPDGPSLGGFVCPATIINADLWKTGQLKPGDKVRFVPISLEQANELERKQLEEIETLSLSSTIDIKAVEPKDAVRHHIKNADGKADVVYRFSGEDNVLVEYGEMTLDLELRLKAHLLMEWVKENIKEGIVDLTPGIRSLQIHFNNQIINSNQLIDILANAEKELENIDNANVPARIVHLPLSWNDPSTQKAIDIYMQSVRDDAPWCPSNLEFIRRINGLDSIDDVKKTVFDASYLVMGLGDVYLGAPVATPLDPRHRLVTTKYNPARTWTPENAVGIGGAYMCIYGMEGPGGYQFVGRTLQMWNRGNNQIDFHGDKPWLLRFFDQIRFFPVSEEELIQIRNDFPNGDYNINIEETQFDFAEYKQFLQNNKADIDQFKHKQKNAFNAERQRWIESGELTK